MTTDPLHPIHRKAIVRELMREAIAVRSRAEQARRDAGRRDEDATQRPGEGTADVVRDTAIGAAEAQVQPPAVPARREEQATD